MKSPFTYIEGSLLIRLLIAHIIVNFLLQSQKSVISKRNKFLKSGSFWLHGLYTAIVAGLLMWNELNLLALTIIVSAHLLIDYLKIMMAKKIDNKRWTNRDLSLFIIDQLLHVIIIVLAWLVIIRGFDKLKLLSGQILPNYRILLRLLSFLVAIGPITYLIKYLTVKWSDEIVENNHSLANAGKWIGMLERVIVIGFVFIEQYAAIGFLITAKSILRLIDKPETPTLSQTPKVFSARKHTEYVLIGTFLSFGSALFIGIIINWLLKF